MKEDIFFSIIVPTYNRSGFLDKTIRSVLTQRYTRFELIIVNDGGNDGTDIVVHSFGDPRIRYFKKENGERAAARNFGTQQAIGDYVTFLDSDDLLLHTHLSTACTHVLNEHPLIFHLGYNVVDDEDNVVYRWKRLADPANGVLIEGNAFSCLGVFIEREVALQHFFNEDRDLSGSEDYELWLRLAARYPIRAFPEVTAKLVNHDFRSVIHFDPEKLRVRIELLRYYLALDLPFMKFYQGQLNRFHALLDLYVALHLAMLPHSKKLAYEAILNSFRKFQPVIFYKRFWVVVKKIFIP